MSMEIYTFIVVLAGWIFSLCAHEWAHARVAYEGGDTSVKEKGYLSFNPLHYADPLLSIALPILFLFLGGLGLPGGSVLIDESRLRTKWWNTLVSLAGPFADLTIAFVIGLIFRFIPPPADAGGPALAFLGYLNVSVFLLSLIPIPPLDGYRAIAPYLDESTRRFCDSLSVIGFFILYFVIFQVDAISNMFSFIVHIICMILGINLELAGQGYDQFTFWR